jgi:hypothetical protein
MATVRMPDGSDYEVKVLLADGDSNTKLRKSDKAQRGYLTVGLSLAPANESGYEVCASRSPGCTRSCIFTSGFGVYDNVKRSRIAKTVLFFEQREVFKAMLRKELHKWRAKANKQGKVLACRLNVFSDILWERIFPELFTEFADVQFYDYTKHGKRLVSPYSLPKNYHLTFSRSECNDDSVSVIMAMNPKANIAVVFDSKELPRNWRPNNPLVKPRKVINGDETDLRFLDESGTIVGLYAKGKGKKDESGFVVSTKIPLEVV